MQVFSNAVQAGFKRFSATLQSNRIFIIMRIRGGYNFRCVLCWFLMVSSLQAQEEEIQSGLVGQYTHAANGSYQTIDADIAFHWGTNDANEFSAAEWTGQILIRSLTPYRFYSQAAGRLMIKIDGEQVLSVESAQSEWTAGEAVKIAPGFREIAVHYEPAADVPAEVKVFWSNDEFEIEPVPAHLLFHEADGSDISRVELGEQLFDAHRCGNCHRSPESTVERFAAPALWGSTAGTNPEWIIEKLLGQHTERMPQFGLSRQQAEEIAAYLESLQAPFELTSAPEVKREKNAPTGEELFHTLGCLACHRLGELGTHESHSGPVLSAIGDKRSKDWLATWLSVPERINPQHRMPTFKLTRSERGELAKYLSGLGKQATTKFEMRDERPSSEVANRGLALIKEFHCSNCHKLPAQDASATAASLTNRKQLDWEHSCLSDTPDPAKHRPAYANIDAAAIREYVEGKLRYQSDELAEFAQGQLVLQRRQCLACHARGTSQGIKAIAKDIAQAVPALQGQTQLLIPPSLDALGDKLVDAVLDQALSGKQDRIRTDWLKVQMPQFSHKPDVLAALKHYFVEHDRIPVAGSADIPRVDMEEGELLLTGRKLIGAGGFSCIACHQVGDYVPKNTALGTRGSDLMAIGKRLRPEFYYRWTRAPLRIVPGMEMPSYNKPVPGVLEDDVHQQLGTLWSALNNPRFEAPTNPTQVEQLWQVAENSPPRIIRDVFTVAEEDGGGAVARAFAFGFSNQHGVLFDLDLAAVREWRFGDLARQRTEGKSWYWDMAGAQVATEFDKQSDLVLIRPADKSILALVGQDEDRVAHLMDYQTGANAIEVRYDLYVVVDEQSISIPVVETFRALGDGDKTGWQREVNFRNMPDGYRMGVLLESELKFQLGGAMQPAEGTVIFEGETGRAAVADPRTANDVVRLNYMASAQGNQVVYPEIEPYPGNDAAVTILPGYIGKRLPVSTSMMPTAMATDDAGRLLVTSLKGHLYRLRDADQDGLEESAELIEEGLAAAFGVAVDGKDILVTHKPELLRLIDTNGDGHIDRREVVADGWGHSDNYHDWVTGPIKTEDGSLLLATGSDYSQPQRDLRYAKWRGAIVRRGTDGSIERYANELRFPMGIAMDGQGRVFVSDQQGVQNTFNEINLIVPGAAYGVPGRLDGDGSSNPRRATIQIPHPWTRSVNGIFFLPEGVSSPFAGHGIGCEFNSKFLLRFTTQEVDGELQGACYPFSRTTWENEANTFLGPICGLATESGEIYIGSLFDSGWLGGPNVGEIVKLTPQGDYENGIREVRAVPGGFQIEFIGPVDPVKGVEARNYSLSGYTRVWQGSYATDDSGRYSPEIEGVALSNDRRTVTLVVPNLKDSFVYEFHVGEIGSNGEELFPSFAAYTLNRLANE